MYIHITKPGFPTARTIILRAKEFTNDKVFDKLNAMLHQRILKVIMCFVLRVNDDVDEGSMIVLKGYYSSLVSLGEGSYDI